MKINKIFHTLYFMVMYLPLFIIPIFAININQKEVEPISITIQETWSETIPLYESNEIESADDLVDGNIYKFTIDEQPSITGYANILDCYAVYNVESFGYISVDTETSNNYLKVRITQYAIVIMSTTSVNLVTIPYDQITFPYSFELVYKQILNSDVTYENFEYTDYQVYETNYYEDEPKVYDNTDIGSQFLYSIYKPVNDYFNFKEYFGMNAIYDWFQLNFFNGTAPLSFFIFFNLMIYWLIISMLWLLFDVLIYVPMMIHRWLDKASIS